MKLFPDEKIIMESDNKSLCLTTHRIRYRQEAGWGQTNITSIMLDKVDACKMRQIVQAVWRYIATITALASLIIAYFKNNISVLGAGFTVAVIFYIMFLLTRRAVISVYSGGATADILTKRMSTETIVDFIDELEKAKNNRYILREQGERQR